MGMRELLLSSFNGSMQIFCFTAVVLFKADYIVDITRMGFFATDILAPRYPCSTSNSPKHSGDLSKDPCPLGAGWQPNFPTGEAEIWTVRSTECSRHG